MVNQIQAVPGGDRGAGIAAAGAAIPAALLELEYQGRGSDGVGWLHPRAAAPVPQRLQKRD